MTDYKLVPVDTLKSIHRDLDACQKVIWLAGGFDPAYCKDAQARLKEIDALLASPAVQGEPVGEAGSLPGTKGFTAAVFESKKVPEGTKLYTAPQPAEQQPAPDVDVLVEALEKYESAFKELFVQCCSNPITNAWGEPVSMAALNDAHAFASSRLAAHRKQGGGQ